MTTPVQALDARGWVRFDGGRPGAAHRLRRSAVGTDARPGHTMESVLDLLDARGWVWFDGDDLVRLTAAGAAQWERMRGR